MSWRQHSGAVPARYLEKTKLVPEEPQKDNSKPKVKREGPVITNINDIDPIVIESDDEDSDDDESSTEDSSRAGLTSPSHPFKAQPIPSDVPGARASPIPSEVPGARAPSIPSDTIQESRFSFFHEDYESEDDMEEDSPTPNTFGRGSYWAHVLPASAGNTRSPFQRKQIYSAATMDPGDMNLANPAPSSFGVGQDNMTVPMRPTLGVPLIQSTAEVIASLTFPSKRPATSPAADPTPTKTPKKTDKDKDRPVMPFGKPWEPKGKAAGIWNKRWSFGSPSGKQVQSEWKGKGLKTGTSLKTFAQWPVYDAEINITHEFMPPPNTILSDKVMGGLAEFLTSREGSVWSGEQLHKYYPANFLSSGFVNLELPPVGRPAIRKDKYMVFGGKILMGEKPVEKKMEELKNANAKKDKKNLRDELESKFWVLQEAPFTTVRKRNIKKSKGHDDTEDEDEPMSKDEIKEARTRRITYTKTALDLPADAYGSILPLYDWDRFSDRATLLSPCDRSDFQQYRSCELTSKQLGPYENHRSPTHPAQLSDAFKKYRSKCIEQKIPDAYITSSLGWEMMKFTGRELLGYDLIVKGKTGQVKNTETLIQVLERAGARIRSDLDDDVNLVYGGSNSGKWVTKAKENGNKRIKEADLLEVLKDRRQALRDDPDLQEDIPELTRAFTPGYILTPEEWKVVQDFRKEKEKVESASQPVETAFPSSVANPTSPQALSRADEPVASNDKTCHEEPFQEDSACLEETALPDEPHDDSALPEGKALLDDRAGNQIEHPLHENLVEQAEVQIQQENQEQPANLLVDSAVPRDAAFEDDSGVPDHATWSKIGQLMENVVESTLKFRPYRGLRSEVGTVAALPRWREARKAVESYYRLHDE